MDGVSCVRASARTTTSTAPTYLRRNRSTTRVPRPLWAGHNADPAAQCLERCALAAHWQNRKCGEVARPGHRTQGGGGGSVRSPNRHHRRSQLRGVPQLENRQASGRDSQPRCAVAPGVSRSDLDRRAHDSRSSGQRILRARSAINDALIVSWVGAGDTAPSRVASVPQAAPNITTSAGQARGASQRRVGDRDALSTTSEKGAE